MKKIGPIKIPLKLRNNKVDTFDMYFFKSKTGRYIVVTKGNVSDGKEILLRIESSCIFGHVFNSVKCDCNYQLEKSLEIISKTGKGMLIYAIDQDALGAGIENHFRIFLLRQRERLGIKEIHKRIGIDKDKRDYSDVVKILSEFNIKNVKLLTNNEKRVKFLRDRGIVVKRVPLVARPNKYNRGYLKFKKIIK